MLEGSLPPQPREILSKMTENGGGVHKTPLPFTFIPLCPVVGLPLNWSRDKAAPGIIHLPDPFSFSGTLAGTFCSPPPTHTNSTPKSPTLKHKTASVRNSRTHSPFRAPHPPASTLDCEGAQGRSRRGRCYRTLGGRRKLGDTLEATNELVEGGGGGEGGAGGVKQE